MRNFAILLATLLFVACGQEPSVSDIDSNAQTICSQRWTDYWKGHSKGSYTEHERLVKYKTTSSLTTSDFELQAIIRREVKESNDTKVAFEQGVKRDNVTTTSSVEVASRQFINSCKHERKWDFHHRGTSKVQVPAGVFNTVFDLRGLKSDRTNIVTTTYHAGYDPFLVVKSLTKSESDGRITYAMTLLLDHNRF